MLADFLRQGGFYTESREALQRSFRLVHDGFDKDEKSEAVALAHCRLAHAYHIEGIDLAKAAEHMRSGIGIFEYLMAQEDESNRARMKLRISQEIYLPFTQLMVDRKEEEEAERLCRMSLRENQKIEGFEAVSTAVAHSMLGQALVAQNLDSSCQEAREHLEKAISISDKAYGDASYVSVDSLMALGDLYLKEFEVPGVRFKATRGSAESKWLEDARTTFLKAIRAGEDILGRISLKAVTCLEGLARVRMYLDEIEENALDATVLTRDSVAPAPAPSLVLATPATPGKQLNPPVVREGSEAPSPGDENVPVGEEELVESSLVLLKRALQYRLLIQGPKHRQICWAHVQLANHHWLHKGFSEAASELNIAIDLFWAVERSVVGSGCRGSREIAKLRSLLVIAHIYMDDVDSAWAACTGAKDMVKEFCGEESWEYHRCLQDECILIKGKHKEKTAATASATAAGKAVEDSGAARAAAGSYGDASRLALQTKNLEQKLKKRDQEKAKGSGGSGKASKETTAAKKVKKKAGKSDGGAPSDGTSAGPAVAATKPRAKRRIGGCEELCVFACAHRDALIHD